MIHTVCPLDGTDTHDEELYPANFDLARVDAEHFSARRIPDGVHYRMVRNTITRCVRADPILNDEQIAQLYRESRITYEDLTDYSATTYLEIFRSAFPLLPDRLGLLEIGCGPGTFLERVRELGFETIAGVEPSGEAAEKARPEIRPLIRSDLFRAGLFPSQSFSAVCGFQVLDHLADPNGVLAAVRELLVPGGITLWICHDIGALPNRLLGRYSPIIDIEHVVLYDRGTVVKLFEKNGFEVIRVSGVANRYPIWYWAQLAPLPSVLKRAVVRMARSMPRATLRMNLGNMGLLARRPLR